MPRAEPRTPGGKHWGESEERANVFLLPGYPDVFVNSGAPSARLQTPGGNSALPTPRPPGLVCTWAASFALCRACPPGGLRAEPGVCAVGAAGSPWCGASSAGGEVPLSRSGTHFSSSFACGPCPPPTPHCVLPQGELLGREPSIWMRNELLC